MDDGERLGQWERRGEGVETESSAQCVCGGAGQRSAMRRPVGSRTKHTALAQGQAPGLWACLEVSGYREGPATASHWPSLLTQLTRLVLP